MVGMKLIKIDRSYIENFLKNDNGKIDKEYIVFTAVLNIIAFYVSAYFSENKMLWGILFTGVNAIILQSLIYFLKKKKHSKKNYYLYTGIYTTLWTISFGILSCVLLRSELGRNSLWIVIIEVLGAIGFAVINYMMYIKKICHKNQYIFIK